MYKLLVILVVASLPLTVRADCTVQSGAGRPHLIELYSSEGCSSCPPAEAWLRGVRNSADAVALEFHVDYWDSLGWRDRFASAGYTARQKALAARANGVGIYTPEVALDGHEWRDWYRRPETPGVAAKAAIKLSAEPGAPLRVHVYTTPLDAAGSAYRNYIALTEDGLATEVRAGENRGTRLYHDHVVRAFIGPIASGDVELPIAADVDRAHATIIAFAQRDEDGDVAQVVALPLAQCPR